MKTFPNALACALLLSSCTTGPGNVVVNLPPYVAQPSSGVSATPKPVTIRIDPVKDARSDAVAGLIGARTGLGNMAMGNIEVEPRPTEVIGQLLKTELSQMGYSVADPNAQLAIGTQLQKFEVATPATALYWDINGAIELNLSVTAQNQKKYDARYATTCTDRTYAWPGEEIIGSVIAKCLSSIGDKIRNDAELGSLPRP